MPEFLHEKFMRAIGGGPHYGDVELRELYASTIAATPDEEPIEADPLKFWPPYVAARWRPASASDGTRTAALKRASAEFLAGFREAK